MIAAEGILTVRGGMTSHAAVVARGMGKPCVAGCDALALSNGLARLAGQELREGDLITIDGGTGQVFIGAVPLVEPQLNEDFETILGWADESRRLEVRANADTPEDATRAREFGAEGIGLCRTEHMFFGDQRLPVVQEMILAETEAERRAALDRLLPFQQSDFEGIFEAMAGLPVTIRLLDPPLHEFLPAEEQATDARMRPASAPCARRTRCSARAAAGSGSCTRRSTRCRSARSRARRRRCSERTGDAPLVEVMHPLVSYAEELRRLAELTERVWAEEAPGLAHLVGTMIEVPRACIRAGTIAEIADFFSFGTNDLTQTTLGVSRDDAEGKFLDPVPRGRRDGAQPVRDPRPARRRRADADRGRAGRAVEARPEDRHLRRARRRAALGRLLPRPRARLRLVLAVPRAVRPARGGAGGDRGGRHRDVRRGRRMSAVATTARAELDRQAENLARLGYRVPAGLGARLEQRRSRSSGREEGRIPFVLVVRAGSRRPSARSRSSSSAASRGSRRWRRTTSRASRRSRASTLPAGDAYLLADVDTGRDTLNVTPDDALVAIEREGRSPLTLDEGLALVTHFPEVLRTHNAFSLLGSRCGDRRVTAIWVSKGAPEARLVLGRQPAHVARLGLVRRAGSTVRASAAVDVG